MTDPVSSPVDRLTREREKLRERLTSAEKAYRENMRARSFVGSWDEYNSVANLLHDAAKALFPASSGGEQGTETASRVAVGADIASEAILKGLGAR